MISLEKLVIALGGRPKADGGFMAHCPAHDDRNPSLSINSGDNGAPILKCFSGCSQEAVIDALCSRDLWHTPGTKLSEDELIQSRHRAEKRNAESRRIAEQSAALAVKVWQQATQAEASHPYLARKQVEPPSTLRQIELTELIKLIGYHPQANGENLAEGIVLVIPVVNDGRISTLELVDKTGRKTALAGGRKKDGYWATDKLPEGDGEGLQLMIGEGVATVLTARMATGIVAVAALSCGNLLPVARKLRERYPMAEITLLGELNKKTGDLEPHATEAASMIGGRVAVPDFGQTRTESQTDLNDLLLAEGQEAVVACLAEAMPVTDNPPRYASVTDKNSCNILKTNDCYVVTDSTASPQRINKTGNVMDDAVRRLASLPPLEYDQQRKEEAERLGVRTSVLDKSVKEVQREAGTDSALPFKSVSPWPEPIDPTELLDEIAATVRRFIVCDLIIPIAVALWVAMTWFLDAIEVCPLAIITAPEKRCGKTQLLTVIGKLVCRPITASSISPAALFRSIDAWQPTLLIDETDACLKDNEELRGLINSGHTRDSAYVIRTVGETFVPTKFTTWGAKALSGIGHIADTLMDRAIILELRRKLPDEHINRLRYAEPGLFDNLARKLSRFAADYSEQVRQARPPLPSSLNDRAQDNWEPLLAIAMVAGPEWLESATQTALKLSGTENAAQSIGVELLADIQDVFDEKSVDKISTKDLLMALIADEERPWASYNRGVPIEPRQLAARLKTYGITSKTVRIHSLSTLKGYDREQFEEAFSRYIPVSPSVSVTTSQPTFSKGLAVTDMKPVTGTTLASVTNFVTVTV